MRSSPKPNPPLIQNDKSRRGFYNNLTERLLCPVDYDWNNAFHQKKICELHPNFLFNPQEPSEGLLKGKILVKAFKAVFTFPTSVDDIDNEEVEASSSRKCHQGEQQTWAHVATLISMKAIQPHAIAYIACQWTGLKGLNKRRTKDSLMIFCYGGTGKFLA
ncbi:hypothetical protein J3R82DRAFT_2172 [Butyriboletus roseoflavus]|nr:hypothetical protein J3R82DRAFT_2172 [Butyriboletus roseoflavus]